MMEQNKKLFASLVVAATAFVGLAGCGNGKEVIKLQLTASKPGEVLNQNARALEPYLEEQMPDYDFQITVGTDFSADATGLQARTIDAAFMTASTFATSEISNPGKINMILRSTRSGFKVIEDFADSKGSHNSAEAREMQRKAMNGKDPTGAAYTYRAEDAGIVSYYYAECIIKRENVEKWDTNNDGEISLAELAGKKICMQGATSPAGYSYPRYAFSQETNNGTWINGMTMVTGTPDASKGEYQYVKGAGYSTDFNSLMNGTYDALWGYMDVRKDAYNGGTGWESWKGKTEVFDDTYTVALTQGILNDGIAVRSDMDSETSTALANAFKTLVKTGDVTDDGAEHDVDGDGKASPAYIIFNLYSHSGYEDAKNSDYNEEIAFQRWSIENLK